MVQHISVRVPWKDNGYDGMVCNKPCSNNSCLRLKNISENRNDELEKGLSGLPILGHEMEIPCLSEGGCFMSSSEYIQVRNHPYSNNSTHRHFLETNLVFPPYSLPASLFYNSLTSISS